MLKRLELIGVGPSPHLGPTDFADRLNLITGDNGLGKTFVLDVAWWSLTGSWPDRQPWPREDLGASGTAQLRATVVGKSGADVAVNSRFDFQSRGWVLGAGRPPMPGLVLYFRSDGRFALWDPAQHYWRRSKHRVVDDPTRPDALHLGADEVWNSLLSAEGKTICRGLIEDWVTWQQTQSAEFGLLQKVLEELSPSPSEPLRPGAPLDPLALDSEDRRHHPTLEMPYGRVPLVLASAGVKRVLALSYLLVWAWQGHRFAANSIKQQPERRLVLLFDEPETHLHPQWQRRVLPSLLRAVNSLGGIENVQVIVSTHAPLVLASVETLFDASKDALHHFDAGALGPSIERVAYSKRGDMVGWLVSPLFGLEQARSVEAEIAIEAAERFLLGRAADNPAGLRSKSEIDSRLAEVLGSLDPFWPRWVVRSESA